jgi:hypothetical protein
MACRILVGHEQGCDVYEQACFFDSVSDTVFGPLMQSEEEAEAFLKWLPDDPRKLKDICKVAEMTDLTDKYAEFRTWWDALPEEKRVAYLEGEEVIE